MDVKEILHTASEVARPVCLRHSQGDTLNTDYKHSVLLVTLKTGEKWVLDVTRAQYGWTELISPWEQYRSHKVLFAVDTKDFGTERLSMDERAEGAERGTPFWTHNMLSAAFHSGIKTWEDMTGGTAADLMPLPRSVSSRREADEALETMLAVAANAVDLRLNELRGDALVQRTLGRVSGRHGPA